MNTLNTYPLIIVDFSHLFNRSLFVAISETKPKKKDGKYITNDYISYFKHLVFNSLQHIHNKFNGEMLLAIDGKDNWRKHFYIDYKANRAKGKEDSDINWTEFHKEVDEIINNINEFFPYKVLEVKEAEADDVAGVLNKEYQDRDIILVSSDHDWLQNIVHNKNTKVYDPIKKDFAYLNYKDKEIMNTPLGKMSKFTLLHSLKGDAGDNVPKVTFETEFSTEFITYLKENNITSTNVKKVKKLSIYNELVNNYNVYVTYKTGKNKGKIKPDYRLYYKLQDGTILSKREYELKNLNENNGSNESYEVIELPQKNIFKTVNFGDKKANEVTKDETSLKKFLDKNSLYKDNFKLSNTLVDVTKVPNDIKNKIIEKYKNLDYSYNNIKIKEYFEKNNLKEHLTNLYLFEDNNATKTSTLDEYLDSFL